MRFAVIGAGPAGFYACEKLLAAGFEVDLLDALPTPFGLVRSGVAPDHPNIKAVTRVYEKTAAKPGFRFFGGVVLGEHVSRAELLERYHGVVYAIGTDLDRRLGIPGEDLPGSYPATRFVAWYNGHPDACDESFDLSAERAVVDRQRQRGDRRGAHAAARSRRAGADRHRRPRDRPAVGGQGVGGGPARPPRARARGLHQPRAARAGGDDRRRRAGRPGRARGRRGARGPDQAPQRRDPALLRRARARAPTAGASA